MGVISTFGYVVVAKGKPVNDGFYWSKWGAMRRCAQERAAGVDAKVYEASFSSAMGEKP